MLIPSDRLAVIVLWVCPWFFASLLWIAAAEVADPSPARQAADETPTPPNVEQLIDQLGSSSFSARQQASRQLKQIGPAAKSALVKALTSSDAEIRHRSRDILGHVLEIDLENRIAAFVADDTGTFDDLPGLTLYQSLAGTSRPAQRLFIRAIRAEPLLLESLDFDAEYASATIKSRAQNLWNQFQRNPSYREISVDKVHYQSCVAALIITIANPEIELDDRTLYFMLQHFERSGLSTYLNRGSEHEEAVRGLVRPLIARSANTIYATHFIRLAVNHNLKSGLVPAEAILRDRQGEQQPYEVLQALLAVGKLGSKDHIQLLTPLLSDVTLLHQPMNGRAKVKIKSQMRDAALAVMIHLSGQDPKDYGYTHIAANSIWLFEQTSMGFTSDEERDEALKKWQTWVDRQSSPAAVESTND